MRDQVITIKSGKVGYSKFAELSPCVYMGKIRCTDCERHRDCDMEAGRTGRQDAFVLGFIYGQKNLLEEIKT